MKVITLTPKKDFNLPVIGYKISPDEFSNKTIEEIKQLPAREGNTRKTIGDLFNVSGETVDSAKDLEIRIEGNAEKVKKIGYKMTAGKITIQGNAGFYLGDSMQNGEIEVEGDALSWLGVRMHGGKIHIHGRAGDFIGGSYRGMMLGIEQGEIIVDKDAGSYIGFWMRGGKIHIKGNTGPFAGMHMQGGQILIEGNTGAKLGALMKKGKIILMGHTPRILPSHTFEEIKKSAKFSGIKYQGPFYLFTGDIAEDGTGKVYINKEANPQLAFYEKYIEDI